MTRMTERKRIRRRPRVKIREGMAETLKAAKEKKKA